VEISNLTLSQLVEAPWNANKMDERTNARLRRSIQKFGLVQPLVVRPIHDSKYEVLSGNQRLKILQEFGVSPIPCCVVALEEAQSRLLAQALNRIHGEDDLGLKSEIVRDLLKALTEEEILSILPDTKLNLEGLANLRRDTLASYLTNWDKASCAKLRNLQFRLTQGQLEVVHKALNKFLARANKSSGDNPNVRGNALVLLCQEYLERSGQ
jgi:ParB family transcriptional regulator, chromosome partitioning protein